jgi:thiosulfate dehydrogenase [quinone] large subunit
MLLAFFESVKYVGHLFPVSFLRVYLGYTYLNLGLSTYYSEFFKKPAVLEQLKTGLELGLVPEWYRYVIEMAIMPNWKIAAIVVMVLQGLVGVSFILGFLVRPMGVLAIAMSLHAVVMNRGIAVDFSKTLLAVNVILVWLGAGRCLGFDYFFYKRNRGIWW